MKSSNQFRAVVCATFAGLIALAAGDARAASVASDDASNYTSFPASGPANQGSGFGAWAITSSGTAGTDDQCYLDTGAQTINSGNNVWGFWGKNTQVITAERLFTGSLSTNQDFQIDLQFQGIGNGTGHATPPGNSSARQAGFELRNSSGVARFRFAFRGGQSNCEISDNAGAQVSIGAGGFPSGGFRVHFRLITADTYEITVLSGINGGAVYSSSTRTLAGTAGTGIDRCDLYCNDNQTGSSGSLIFFNRMRISYASPAISAQPSSTTTSCSGLTTPAMAVTASSLDGSTLAYAWRKRGSGWGKVWTLTTSGTSGSYLGTPNNANGEGTANIGSGNYFALWSNNGSENAIRSLPVTMDLTQTFSIDMQCGNQNTGGSKVGFGLTDASGNAYFEFQIFNGQTDYTIHDSASGSTDTGIPKDNMGVHVDVTITGGTSSAPTSYRARIIRLSTGATSVITGNLVTGGGQSGGISKMYMWNVNTGANCDAFYNNIMVGGADDKGNNYSTWTSGSSDLGQKPLADGSTGNGSSYAGSATSSFTITTASTSDNASYDCAVMSGQGYTTISSASALTVNGTPSSTFTKTSGSDCINLQDAFNGPSGTSYTYAWSLINNTSGASFSGGSSSQSVTVNNGATASQSYGLVLQVTSNTCSSSSTQTITVVAAPTVSTPSTATACTSPGTASIASTPTGASSYQWYKSSTPLTDNSTISGSTSATLNFSGLTTGDSGSTFKIVATGCGGATATSGVTTLTVNLAVSVTAPPTNYTACSAGSAAFTVAATGTGLSYQWQRAGTNVVDSGAISGSTTATISLNNLTTNDTASTWQCVVSGTAPCANATSAAATLTVNQAVSITGQPAAQTATAGSTATFAVTATGAGLTYQWQVFTNGASVWINVPAGTGSTSTTYSTNSVTAAMSGYQYRCVVSGTSPCSAVTSSAATLTVLTAPSISVQPANTAICSNSTANFSVTASGSPTPAYMWMQHSNAGWGGTNTWSASGSGGTFLGTSTGNEAGGAVCNSFDFKDVNSTNVNGTTSQAFGIFGASELVTRKFPTALAAGQVFRIDMDNGVVDSGHSNGFSLATSTGTDLIQFYNQGNNAATGDYFYQDSTGAHDTGMVGGTNGVRVAIILGSSNGYLLTVTACGGTSKAFSGTYAAGSIGMLRLFNNNTTGGGTKDIFFNNIIAGGLYDFADNYTGSWVGSDKGDQAIAGATGSSYTTPALATNTQYEVIVTNAAGAAFSSANIVTATVNANPVITTASPLPAGTTGVAYSQTLASSGGTGPYTYSVGSGLPTGITLSSGGVLSGTTGAAGTYNFTVTVTDSSSTLCTGSKAFSLTINCPTITVSPTTLPTVSIGVAYSQTVSASGSSTPYTYSIGSGALPAGITLNSGSGLISGTYNGSAGSATFTVTATDTNNCAGSRSYTVNEVVCPTITLSPNGANPTALASGTINVSYNQSVTASGSAATPYTYSVQSGSLPAGLTLSSSTGAITGTPTTQGTSTFTILATDTNGCAATQSYSITINCPTITVSPNGANPTVLTGGTLGTPYTQTITASGGIGATTFAKTSGTLPTGVSLSSGGVLSGTPTVSGTYTFTVTATDTKGCTGSQAYSLTMTCPSITVSLLSVNNSSLPFGVSNQTYSATNNIFTASGSAATPYTFSSGTLPTGLSLTSGGILSGTPTTTNTVAFSVIATDTNGCTGNTSCTITNGWPVAITSQPTNFTACSGTTASFTVTATGSGPLSYLWRKNGTSWGTGNAWTFVAAGCTATHGYYVGDSTACGGISPGIGTTYSLYANSGDAAEATRNFSNLQVGQSVVIDYQNPRDMSSAGVGTTPLFALRDSSGTARFQFYFNGGDANYTINDQAGAYNSGIPYTAAGLRLTFTLVDANHYNLQVARLSSGTNYTYVNQTLGGTSGNAISQMRFYYRNSGTGGTTCQDLFFNVISVGGYTDLASNYTGGGCGTTSWTNSANLGQGPLSDAGSVSGSATPTLQLSNVSSTDSGVTYSVVVYNPYGALKSANGLLNVNASPTITTASPLSTGSPGVVYSQTLASSGGTTPYTYSVGSGLPTGFTVTSSGVVTGTTSVAGTYNFTITVTDSSATHCPGSKAFSMTIACPTITVSPTTLPNVSIGVAYSQTVSASGSAAAPYTYSITSGALPSGITLDSSSGIISGTYNGSAGSATFTVTATDTSNCTGSRSYTVNEVSCPTITLSPNGANPTVLAGGTINVAYNQSVTASGGVSPYTYVVSSGSLPAGLSIDSSTGAITGSPTAQGTSTFTILANDANGCPATQSYSITIICPTITVSPNGANPTVLTGGTAGTAYSQTVTASGGIGAYTFAKTSGTLPTGLTLSSAGVLSGTPSAGGTFLFTVTATDTKACTGSQAYSVTITCPTITVSLLSVNNSALPFGVSNQTYSATNNIFTASGSPAAPYTFSSGTLPAGLSLSSGGVLSGTPTTTNTVTYSVTATDTNGCTGSTSYTVTNGWAVAITTQPANTTVCSGSTANFSVTATGTGPLSYGWRKRGSGWGAGNAWTFNPTACGANAGTYVGDSTACGVQINPGIGNALGIYANNGASQEITRNFANLAVGQSVVLDYQNPQDMSSSGAGTIPLFALRDSGGTARFEFYFFGGDAYYTINDANPLVNSSGIPYNKSGLHIVFTLTGADTYNLQVQDLGSGKWYTYVNRTLSGTSGNAISQMRFYYRNTGTGGTACQDFFINNIYVGAYSDGGGNYTSGGCGVSSWINGSNNGQGPLANGATGNGSTVSGATTAALQISNVATSDAATYDVIVWNSFGSAHSTATLGVLTVDPHPNLSLSETDVTCNGGSDGAVTATFSNGTGISGALQAKIDGGSFSALTSPHSFTALVAGSHTVTVQDVNGCTSNLTITVNQPAAVTFTTSQVNESCNGQSIGSITVTASGGSGSGYTYSKNNGSTYQAGNVFSSLAAGTYNIVVKDSNGCLSSSTPVTITQPSALSLSLGETDVSCNGGSDGMVTATFSGGTPAYQVKIDGGSYSAQSSPYTFTGLTAGLHTVSLQDANGCTTSQSITVNESPAPSVTASSDAPFFQGQYQIVQGQTLHLSASFVNGATSYNWSRDGGGTFATGQTASDTPPAGTHTYTVTAPTACGTAVGSTPNIVVLTADGTGVPDSWKTEHGYSAGASSSTVGANGFTLLQSYEAGLDPTSSTSQLDMSSAKVTPAGMMTVSWQSQQDGTTPTRLYDFYSLTSPYTNGGSWSRIESNIAPAGATTSLSDDVTGVAQRFYRVTIAGHTNDVATIGIAGVQMLTLEDGANYISMSTTQTTPTLLSVLGTNLPQGAFESTATTVDIWDQTSQAFLMNNARYWLGTGASGWKQHNTAAASNNVQLDPTKGFVVTIRTGQGPQTLYVPGFVPTGAESQAVQSNGYSVASSTYPQSITLTGSGLSNAVTGGISLNKSDNLLFFDSATQLFDIRVWYYTGDHTWRNADASLATQELQPGSAFLIQRRNRSTNLIWTNPVPYQVPLQGP